MLATTTSFREETLCDLQLQLQRSWLCNVQTRSNMFKHVQTCSNMFKPIFECEIHWSAELTFRYIVMSRCLGPDLMEHMEAAAWSTSGGQQVDLPHPCRLLVILPCRLSRTYRGWDTRINMALRVYTLQAKSTQEIDGSIYIQKVYESVQTCQNSLFLRLVGFSTGSTGCRMMLLAIAAVHSYGCEPQSAPTVISPVAVLRTCREPVENLYSVYGCLRCFCT